MADNANQPGAVAALSSVATTDTALPRAKTDSSPEIASGRADRQLFVATGFDEAVAPMTLGVSQDGELWRRRVRIAGSVTMPMLRPDPGDLRLAAWLDGELLRAGGWNAGVRIGATVTTTANDAFTGGTLGSMQGAFGGYDTARWSLGIEAVHRVGWLSYLATTDYARSVGGSASKGGWYRNTSVGLEAGVRAALRLGAIELVARAGYERRGTLDLVIPPVYVTLGAGVRF
jgi:hypothetical protein